MERRKCYPQQNAARVEQNQDAQDLVIVGKAEFLGILLDATLPMELLEKVQDEQNRNGRVYIAVPRVLFEQWKASLG